MYYKEDCPFTLQQIFYLLPLPPSAVPSDLRNAPTWVFVLPNATECASSLPSGLFHGNVAPTELFLSLCPSGHLPQTPLLCLALVFHSTGLCLTSRRIFIGLSCVSSTATQAPQQGAVVCSVHRCFPSA